MVARLSMLIATLYVMFPAALYNYVLWRRTEEKAPSTCFFVSLGLVLLSAMLTVVVDKKLKKRKVCREDETPIAMAESDS